MTVSPFFKCNIFCYSFSATATFSTTTRSAVKSCNPITWRFCFLFHTETLRFQTARFFGVALRQLQHFLLFCRMKYNIFYYISR